MAMNEILQKLGITGVNAGMSTGTVWFQTKGAVLDSFSPINNQKLGTIVSASKTDYQLMMGKATEAFQQWRKVPAPIRAEVVRQIGLILREHKEDLGRLVSLEMGKIYHEGLGEVQEMIDICDFAVGQARLLNGFTMHSERSNHRMYDQYHPLGIVGVITSFNFPVAVWAWNSMLACIAGDVVVWKPSSKAPLCAIAVQKLIQKVLVDNQVPEGVFNLIIGSSKEFGDDMLADHRIPLISLTGSTKVGKHASAIVGARLGRTIMELGGNNAVIVSEKAELQMAIPAIVFGSVGTTGQRCTSTRRVIVHESIYPKVKELLLKAYEQVSRRIGNPLDPNTLVGPLVDQTAVKAFQDALHRARQEGGTLIFGGQVLEEPLYSSKNYVVPAIVEAENHYSIVQEETFAPIVYLLKYKHFDEAIALNNNVPQGLSSSVFTQNIRESEKFLSEVGSDCGIANVNVGTSGAEIGGAFGGEKDTGGGRESGSDSWKAYMRRQTNTINYGEELPLAQGIKFDL
ncbi:MAG TPA: aldehyde dehydrogenase family protein [Marinilabiliales bacterium]|nr:MAG: aldehyde dehydrogenase [Bacteroidetes bacterium GWA2_40_14]OFX73992.1 MAG: aldehyde dehydrogenase [Bacteroidetes bacterium GWD2_40_43]OFX93174.1 MAG: aldehyde dehydrogenase [Bacteroidetes bacterium GWE2_40_63]OFY21544.1 MAG: aldehyde dehydrogenase [Bacteroidetes bacterium GWF2_40_13]OFZ24197.1 MAG: aldehyde dehydrogenase [Bacteroidetes bacterium RIFOXYC2_FULL_40_12]HAM98059.1 aldehyde dehydrogenase family protein [Marinilabiliales bacterium]